MQFSTVNSTVDDTASVSGASQSNLKVGDRVLVSGTKNGILRFVGPTEFAQGLWGGVELDQPIGKNDGAVQGKRSLHQSFLPSLNTGQDPDLFKIFRLQTSIRSFCTFSQN